MKDVVVKNSEINRKGLFANRDFKKGETVTTWDISHTITPDEYKALPDKVKEHVSNLGNGKYVIIQSPERYVNHSCDPNTIVQDNSDVALKDIKKGEEITSNYSVQSDHVTSFKCNCGSENCQGTVWQ